MEFWVSVVLLVLAVAGLVAAAFAIFLLIASKAVFMAVMFA